MKQIIITILILSTFLTSSCAYKSGTENAPKQNIDVIELSIVTQNTTGSPYDKGYIAFANKLNELSGGTMTVAISHLMDFGTIEDMFDAVMKGAIDMTTLGYSDKSDLIPELVLASEPYIINDYKHLLRVLASDYGKKMNEKFNELGVDLSSVWYGGVRQVTSNKPIRSLNDFKGLRFRAAPTEASISFAENMGAIATPIRFSDLYNALERAEVEAQENPLSIIESRKLYQVQNCIVLTDHSISTVAVLINKEKYDSFTDEQKAWYNEALEYGKEVCNNIIYNEESILLDKFRNEYGMTLTTPDKDELKAAMTPRYKELERRYGDIVLNVLATK